MVSAQPAGRARISRLSLPDSRERERQPGRELGCCVCRRVCVCVHACKDKREGGWGERSAVLQPAESNGTTSGGPEQLMMCSRAG